MSGRFGKAIANDTGASPTGSGTTWNRSLIPDNDPCCWQSCIVSIDLALGEGHNVIPPPHDPQPMSTGDHPPVLKAILVADLAQYSRLTAVGEDAAVDSVMRCLDLFKTSCAEHRGEFVKSTGDGVLVLFDSVSDALAYALGVQERLVELAADIPAAGRFRVGVHIGEVHRRANDVYGHAVNLAARVQALADPGTVCVTQEVYQAARSRSRFSFRFSGRHALKNMQETMATYHVGPPKESEPTTPSQFSIAVIDGLAVLDARGEPAVLRSRTAQALIGYLALTEGFRDLRERIATLLWPEQPPAEASASLNRCIRVASKILASSGLRRHGYVGLDPARVTVDLSRILSDLDDAEIDDTLLRPDWPEAILHGFESVNSLFGTWLRITRQSRRDRAQEALERLLESFESRDPITKRAATALLALEPSHEGAVCCLMRHHSANHNIAAALRAYEALCHNLHEQYGVEPSVETGTLAASLSRSLRRSEDRAAHPGRIPVIVIGGFMTGSESIAAAVSGFRAELIINISKFREFTIVDLKEESDSTGIDYVLTAECSRIEAEISICAILKEARTKRIIWSDLYRLSLDKWLTVQKHLVAQVASTLEIYLSQDRLSRALQRLPEDLGVYDAWLRGEHLLLDWSARSEDEAEKLFKQAIAQDPSFAPAHASLASVYNSRPFIRPGLPNPPPIQGNALELARRAVELDPLDARNLMAGAWAAAMVQRFDQAELYFELASELNPNNPKVLVSASLGLAFMGRTEVALKLLRRTTELTTVLPAYQWSHIASIRFLAGDYEGAIEAADRSQDVIIDTPGWKAAALGRLGRTEERGTALGQLIRAAKTAWAGPRRPTTESILAWFVSAFPLRHDSDREKLADALRSDYTSASAQRNEVQKFAHD